MRKLLSLTLLSALLLLGSPAQAAGAEGEPLVLPDALLLVSPLSPMPSYLEPDNLVPVSSFARGNSEVKLRADAAQALQNMLQGLQEAGISDIYVSSGYRNFVRQGELHTAKVAGYRKQGADEQQALALAARWVLPPGESEHQTGLAVDLSTAGIGYDVGPAFANTAACRWLAEHCADYGFIVRYSEATEPLTGVAAEPWHFRFVGEDHAYYMRQHDLCLEEYHSLLAGQGLLMFDNAAGEQRAVHYSQGDTSASLPGEVLAVSLARKGSGEYIITVLPPALPLPDIRGHWGEVFIRRLYDLRAIDGYPDGSFRPEANISRGEFITLLARLPLPVFNRQPEPESPPLREQDPPAGALAGTQNPAAEDGAPDLPEQEPSWEAGLPGPIVLPYTDVAEDQYYYLPLTKCFNAFLVQALSESEATGTQFKPERPLLRGEAALMLARALCADSFILPPAPSYRDVPPAAGELFRSVELLTARGVFSGDGQGSFYPGNEISRAETSAVLVRLLDAANEAEAESAKKEESAGKAERAGEEETSGQ